MLGAELPLVTALPSCAAACHRARPARRAAWWHQNRNKALVWCSCPPHPRVSGHPRPELLHEKFHEYIGSSSSSARSSWSRRHSHSRLIRGTPLVKRDAGARRRAGELLGTRRVGPADRPLLRATSAANASPIVISHLIVANCAAAHAGRDRRCSSLPEGCRSTGRPPLAQWLLIHAACS